MSPSRSVLSGVLLLGLLLAAGAGWWFFTATRFPAFRLILVGSRSSSDALDVSGGNLVVTAPDPGIFFGTVRKPGHREEFTYLVVFRYGPALAEAAGHGIQFQCSSEGGTAEVANAIEIGDARIAVDYHIELDRELTGVDTEALTVNGSPVDMAAGRVFLVDLTAGAPEYRQRRVDLPPIEGRPETTDAVEALVGAVRKSLAEADPEIAAFLK